MSGTFENLKFKTPADKIYHDRVVEIYDANSPKLTNWEIDFIEGIINRQVTSFSEKQRAVINGICEKIGIR